MSKLLEDVLEPTDLLKEHEKAREGMVITLMTTTIFVLGTSF